MSLKITHIVIILASIAVSFGFASWAVQDYLFDSRSVLNLSMGIFCALLGTGLVFYLHWFREKTRQAGL